MRRGRLRIQCRSLCCRRKCGECPASGSRPTNRRRRCEIRRESRSAHRATRGESGKRTSRRRRASNWSGGCESRASQLRGVQVRHYRCACDAERRGSRGHVRYKLRSRDCGGRGDRSRSDDGRRQRCDRRACRGRHRDLIRRPRDARNATAAPASLIRPRGAIPHARDERCRIEVLCARWNRACNFSIGIRADRGTRWKRPLNDNR